MKKVAYITSDMDHWVTHALNKSLSKYADVKLLNIENLRVAATQNKWNVYHPKLKLSSMDTVFIRGCQAPAALFDFKLTVSEHLEFMGLDVINSSKSIRISRNKFSAIQVLQKNGIPTPKTRLALTPKAAMKSIRKMKKPVIIKLLKGSCGKGVMKISSNDEAESVIDALSVLNEMIYFQEYIENEGKDIRVFVVGDEIVTAMERYAKPGGFRSNISQGGKGSKVELDNKLEKLALKSAKVVGTDIAGVDLILNGKPKVIEINSNPGLDISKITKVDVADRIAKYIADK